ncbi:MAG: zinc ribbon domain-containing protein [Chloroflexota bacterium]|nr:zinc ribbon domain-containing protein [Chloroflexota bacterium]MDQ5865112.1 zinc ribbon domain-containing protein [Chloroflexota bacterium]
MPYCDNCGQPRHSAKNFCRSCGEPLAQVGYSGYVEVANLSEGVATGIETAHDRMRRRESTSDASNESLELYLKFIMIIALFHGVAYMGGSSILSLLNGNLGLVLYGGVIIGALFKMVADVRLGYSFGRSLIEVVLFGALAYGVVFGVFWWLTETYIHGGKPLFDFSSLNNR